MRSDAIDEFLIGAGFSVGSLDLFLSISLAGIIFLWAAWNIVLVHKYGVRKMLEGGDDETHFINMWGQIIKIVVITVFLIGILNLN